MTFLAQYASPRAPPVGPALCLYLITKPAGTQSALRVGEAKRRAAVRSAFAVPDEKAQTMGKR